MMESLENFSDPRLLASLAYGVLEASSSHILLKLLVFARKILREVVLEAMKGANHE